MYTKYRNQFAWMSQTLLDGRYDDLAQVYAVPLHVSLESLQFIIWSRDELTIHLRRHHQALIADMVSTLRPEIGAVDLRQIDGARRVWVQWHSEGRLGSRRADVVYQLRDGMVLSMTYYRLAMPEFAKPGTHRRLLTGKSA